MKKRVFLSIVLVFSLIFSACGKSEEPKEPTGKEVESEAEMGELVPDITILASLPEEDIVNYEMAKELASELEKLGVNIQAQATDFSVIVDKVYGAEGDFQSFTVGWSGRVERLDPDMYLHSINHSSNAVAGGNNIDKYRNPEFDKLADAQRQEMDIEKRRDLVFQAQEILGEDVPRVTLYSRANVQAYNKDKFRGVVNIPGEGLFNEWTPMFVEPITGISSRKPHP